MKKLRLKVKTNVKVGPTFVLYGIARPDPLDPILPPKPPIGGPILPP